MVIAADGAKIGEMGNREALAMAQSQGLDLVEVSPEARPPICRIMDYGKFLYEQKKKSKRAKQKGRSLKEVKFRPKIDTHDFETKLRHIRGFLEKGDNVKVTIVFRRGREMIYRERGVELATKVREAVADLSSVEKRLAKESFNTMVMTLAPKKGAGKKKQSEENTSAAQQEGKEENPGE